MRAVLAQQNISLTNFLNQVTEGLGYLLPEITLVATLILLLLFDLIFKKNKAFGFTAIASIGFALAGVMALLQWSSETVSLFGGMLSLTNFSLLLKVAFSFGGLVTLLIAWRGKDEIKAEFFKSGETLIMLAALLLGAFFMTMTMNLLLVYVSIELVSIASYILTGLTGDRKRSEAGIKYLIFGAASSAIMLYGMSWLYGFTGTLQLDSDSFYAGLTAVPMLPLIIAMVLTLAGFLFKLGAFPLHVWSPDVYEATPTPTVAMFSAIPKLAALTIVFRLVELTPDTFDWVPILTIVAIASMTVGNFSALWQKDAKRMLAYSSIAHAGFLLVGIITHSETGNEAMLFYGLVYLIMNFAAFFLINQLESITGSTKMESLKGLGRSMPFAGVLMVLVMVSLTGLPPTAGFNAKLYIFSALWEAFGQQENSWLLWLFIFGLFNTVVSLFYYLKIPYMLFFKELQSNEIQTKGRSADYIIGTLLVLPLLLLFFRSDWFVDLMNTINFVF
ncbi:NADH-quinone oxidoreductase subunit N [Roseivirga pacifica]|uniref:NADH-quinone oxidoreductase subunit N n=1 Tax=Roseivirga pacifica TaxID=1267423 RepID=UPI003BAF6247